MPTSNLGVATLVQSQANKIVSINEAFEAFDQATQGVAEHDAEGGDLTLTVEQFSAAYLLDFTGAPGADRNITLPANVRRSFGVRNSTGRPLTLQLDGVMDSGVELAGGAVAAFVSTTTELLRMTADATGGGGAAITVEDEGTALATDAETLNFTGAGVTVTNDGTTASKKVINIPAATAGDGGLTAVETDATLGGDGTSGDPLGIADGGVDTTQLANDAVTVDKVENALLARVPASALPAPSNANNGKVVGLTATAYAAVDAPAGGASLIIADETTDLATPATRIQFQGAGVTAANDGTTAATKVITIPGASGTGGYTPAVSDKTADYIVVNGDQGNTVRATGSTALTFTLPDVATPIAAGWWVRVANASSAALTIDGNGADTIDGEATLEVAAGDVVTLQVVGATAWMVLTTTAGGGTSSGTFKGAAFLLKSSVSAAFDADENADLSILSWADADYDIGGWWDSANATRFTVPEGVTRVRVTFFASRGYTDTAYIIGSAYTSVIVQQHSTSDDNSLVSPVLPVSSGDYFEAAVWNVRRNATISSASFGIEAID